MSSNIKKNICVIGAGKWGQNHIRTLDSMDCLYGVVDNNISAINNIKTTYPDVKTFDNILDAMNNEVDGFVIATPAPTHFKLAKDLIENKYNLLIEKPMTLNSEDAKKLVDMSSKYGTKLMVGHILLFHPAIIKIKELIDQNKIGKLQYIYSNRLNLGKVRTQENVFWSFAPHDISILQYLVKSYPIEVKSHGSSFLQPGIHDTTMTHLSYNDNIKAHIYLSWLHPFKEHRIVVIGSDGMLSFEDSSQSKEIIFYDKKVTFNDNIPIEKNGAEEIIFYDEKQPLKEELKYFISSFDNKNMNKSDASNGFDVIKILEQATNSLKSEITS